jgi:thiol-disulfide isomerase/thioredoxin
MASTKSGSKPKSGSKKARAAERRRKAERKKLVVRATMVVGVAMFVGVFVFAVSEGDTAVGTTDTESWDLPALADDSRVTLAQFEGKPTVAAFFASWCTVCRRELPGFAQLSSALGDDVNFVGINAMNNGSGLSFAQQMGIGHWPLARDIGMHDGRQLVTNFGARGSPTTVIYDENGAVVDVTLGRLTAQQLAQKLNQFFGVAS